MAAADLDVIDDNATLAYLVTEEAKLVCRETIIELAPARRALAEAAYYLSDTLAPDDRERIVDAVERHLWNCGGVRGSRAETALVLADDAVGTVEAMLRVPGASGELRAARTALLRAIDELTGRLGVSRAGALLLHRHAAA